MLVDNSLEEMLTHKIPVDKLLKVLNTYDFWLDSVNSVITLDDASG